MINGNTNKNQNKNKKIQYWRGNWNCKANKKKNEFSRNFGEAPQCHMRSSYGLRCEWLQKFQLSNTTNYHYKPLGKKYVALGSPQTNVTTLWQQFQASGGVWQNGLCSPANNKQQKRKTKCEEILYSFTSSSVFQKLFSKTLKKKQYF